MLGNLSIKVEEDGDNKYHGEVLISADSAQARLPFNLLYDPSVMNDDNADGFELKVRRGDQIILGICEDSAEDIRPDEGAGYNLMREVALKIVDIVDSIRTRAAEAAQGIDSRRRRVSQIIAIGRETVNADIERVFSPSELQFITSKLVDLV